MLLIVNCESLFDNKIISRLAAILLLLLTLILAISLSVYFQVYREIEVRKSILVDNSILLSNGKTPDSRVQVFDSNSNYLIIENYQGFLTLPRIMIVEKSRPSKFKIYKYRKVKDKSEEIRRLED
jgi:hypothetical protein